MKPTRILYCESYRGFNLEVSQHFPSHKPDNEGTWCGYITLALEQFPEEIRDSLWCPLVESPYGSRYHKYFDCPLSQLEWHGGMTYYEKKDGEEAVFKVIKVGCDYSHLWDEGGIYDAERVMRDLRSVVDEMHILWKPVTMESLWKERHAEFNKRVLEKKVAET